MLKFVNLNKGISTPIGILIIVLVAVIAGSGILAWQYFDTQKETEISQEKTIENETAGWKIYRNEEYGFEIKYPPELDGLERVYGSDDLGTPKGIQFSQPGFPKSFPLYDFRAGKLIAEYMGESWISDPCGIPSYEGLSDVAVNTTSKDIEGIAFTRIEVEHKHKKDKTFHLDYEINYIGKEGDICYRFFYNRDRDYNMTEKDDLRFEQIVSTFKLLSM